MVIDSMFVFHFVDLDLRVEIIFRKEGPAENGGIDFEIGDTGTSAHWYRRLNKFHAEPVCFFITFLVTKKIAFKSPSDLYFYPFNIEFF